MSPKQRKKAPRVKKQTSSASDSSSVTSPVIATTNYREIHLNEVEALRSIYGDDYEEVETRRSAWQVGGTWLDLELALEPLSDL
jgi:translation initiation factor 2-alpha kinase 4